MKKRILFGAVAALMLWQARAETAWLTDLPAAEAQAKAENKVVLLDFVGSDWCPDCQAFMKDVLSSQKFQEYAARNVVVVELDFPDRKVNKAKQSDALKKANEALKERYDIEAWPTFIVLDKNGKQIGSDTGYDGKGPDNFITWLEKMKIKAAK